MKKLIGPIAITFLLSACTDYLAEYKDEYEEEFAEETLSSSEPEEVSSSSKKASSSSVKAASSSSVKASSSSKKATSSSSAKVSSSSEKAASSSSAKSSSSVKASSSSKKAESSSSKGTGSSSSADEVGVFGTCGPSKAAVELNETANWTFSWDTKSSGVTINDLADATYNWTSEGGTPATATGRTLTTTYTTSGPKTASVEVSTTQHGSQTIQCSTLNVNGAPITGCKCVGTNIIPDVSLGEQASWAITGCKSTANIIGYTWTGATADGSGMTATAPVSAKGDMVTGVSVKVANDDNSIVTVQCEDAKAIDSRSPDYLFEISGAQVPTQKLEVPSGACMSIRGTWENSGYSPIVSVLCDGQAGYASNMTFEMTYGSKIYQARGEYFIANAGGQIGELKAGPVQFDDICVKFSGVETVTCKLQ